MARVRYGGTAPVGPGAPGAGRAAARLAVAGVLAGLLAGPGLAGCTGADRHRDVATVTSTPAAPATGTGPSSGTGGGAQPLPTGHAPTRSYSVGTQTLRLARGDRSLPTSVWYPARRAGSGTPAVTGTFPLVLFSHGLNGLPANYAPLLRRWAAAGFVVAAPAHPHTRHGASDLALSDVVEQPADISAVITAVLEPGRLRARVDPRRIAAAGHSAGGITTVLLFGPDRDPRLVAGVAPRPDRLEPRKSSAIASSTSNGRPLIRGRANRRVRATAESSCRAATKHRCSTTMKTAPMPTVWPAVFTVKSRRW